jgi:hypothetical protein
MWDDGCRMSYLPAILIRPSPAGFCTRAIPVIADEEGVLELLELTPPCRSDAFVVYRTPSVKLYRYCTGARR